MTRVHDLRTPAWRVEAGALEHNLRSMADCGLESIGMDHGDPTIDGAKLWFCSDEHLTFAAERRVRVGDRIRVRPAHVDPTVAYHEQLHVVSGEEVLESWDVDLRGW